MCTRRFLAPHTLSPLLLAGACALVAACHDISRFTTDADESYCGNIVPGPFVRQGFGPGVRMRLTFDADRIGDLPGIVTTDDDRFKEAALRPIPQLNNDPLSTLEFGEGRVRNLLLGLGASDGQTATAVVSLLENGKVEVRILRGAPLPPGVTARPAQDASVLFGVFPLTRQKGTCGF